MKLCKIDPKRNVRKEEYIEYRPVPKNYLKTKHFLASAVATVAGILIAIYPNVESLVVRNTKFKKEDIQDVSVIINTILGAIAAGSSSLAMHDRVTNQRKMYTPRGIIGHNLEDVLEE